MKKTESDKIAIGKIEIKIGDKTITLKPEQLRDLHKIIGELLGEDKLPAPVENHTHIHSNPWLYVNTIPAPTPYWTVYCQGNLSASVSNLCQSSADLAGTATLALNN